MTDTCAFCKKEITLLDGSTLTIEDTHEGKRVTTISSGSRIRTCDTCRHEYAKQMEISRKQPNCTKCKDEFYACEECMYIVRKALKALKEKQS